jgi:hypothetical protein
MMRQRQGKQIRQPHGGLGESEMKDDHRQFTTMSQININDAI